MKSKIACAGLIAVALLGSAICSAQQSGEVRTALKSVPRIIRYSGELPKDRNGHTAEVLGISFAIYDQESDGPALWREVQNVHIDSEGKYTVQLGDATSGGLPANLFSAGEARWLGVQVNGEAEQPRELFLSVPYALSAGDAQTLGGLPASAYVQVAHPGTSNAQVAPALVRPSAAQGVTTSGGAMHKLAVFDSASDITSSQIFDNGTSIGIGNTTPAARLDVSGTGMFHGSITLPAPKDATTATGVSSPALNLSASAYNSSAKAAQNQTFTWRVDPLGNNSSAPSGKLNLLFNNANTGFSISNKGLISFAPGQTFPGVAHGVESITLSVPPEFKAGNPVFGSGTLSFDWVSPPTSLNTPNALVKRDAGGGFAATTLRADSIVAQSLSVLGTANSGAALMDVVNNAGFQSDLGYAVVGQNSTPSGAGVLGQGLQGGIGVQGLALGTAAYSGQGVWGESTGDRYGANGFGPDGVDGISHSRLGSGVVAINTSTAGGDGLYAAAAAPGVAGYFAGDVHITGTLSKAGGSFKIDHPLDPANKYLSHSFVESPEMMNIYNGEVTTDAQGNATIRLPDYFEALNRDFRYQLAVIGQFAEAIVTSKVAHNSFSIKTDKPNVEVSWQITGIRHDAWANAHRIPVEEEKPETERGHYMHPELFGALENESVEALHRPGMLNMRKAAREGKPLMPLPVLPATRPSAPGTLAMPVITTVGNTAKH